MSRCFPFPPPGFEKKHDALIESIKLQKERERAKKERKREKRKEKKEKSRDKASSSEDKKNKKRLRDDKSQYDKQCSKTRDEESEQLERSSLTEEQGMPSARYTCDSPDSSQHSCKRKKYSEVDVSKNTPGCGFRIKLPLHKQTSGPSDGVEPPCKPVFKQKETASHSLAQQGQSLSLPKQKKTVKRTQQGSLSLSKQKETSLHAPAQQWQSLSLPKQKETALHASAKQQKRSAIQPCQISSLPKQKETELHGLTTQRQCLSSSKPQAGALPAGLPAADEQRSCLSAPMQNDAGLGAALEQPCFSGRTDTNLSQGNGKSVLEEFTSLGRNRGSSKSRKKEAKFRDLFLNWNPEPFQLQLPEDQEWLFGGRRQHQNNDVLADKGDSDLLDGGGVLPSWPPQACLLPEAGVYALPFVLPF